MMSINNQPIETMQTMRAEVNRHMVDLGANREEVKQLDESVLCDGKYEIAIRFRAGQLIAVWNFSHGSLQFYDHRGSRLRTVTAR